MRSDDPGDFGIIHGTRVWQGHHDDYDTQVELEAYVEWVVTNYRPDFVGETELDAERFASARFNESWYVRELVSWDPGTIEFYEEEEWED